jgi:RHS repeat-associated protein
VPPPRYTWEPNGAIPELLDDGTTSYLYGPNGPVEQVTDAADAPSCYLHGDQQDSTLLITNATGAQIGSYTYNAYGTVTNHTGTATSALQYDGQYTDPTTGYLYLRARDYDPATVLFITSDPADAETGQPYSYAENDPLDESDPSGLCVGAFGYCVGFHPMAGVDALINIGRGASFGLTDKFDNLVSPGASCTVAQNGIDQFIGSSATLLIGGEAWSAIRAIRLEYVAAARTIPFVAESPEEAYELRNLAKLLARENSPAALRNAARVISALQHGASEGPALD